MSLAGLYNYPGCIRTHSGLFVNPFDMTADDINIEDIAHALAHIPRFGGHTHGFYSVAEHSMEVALRVPAEFRLDALLHDASEAYLLDLPTPIKNQLPEYHKAEYRIQGLINNKYNVNVWRDEVKAADKAMLEFEWVNIVLTDRHTPMLPHDAKAVFLDTFKRYI